LDYAKQVVAALTKHGLRVELDASEEKLGYRLRNAQVNKIPVTLVVGDKEAAAQTVMARRYGLENQVPFGLNELIQGLIDEIATKSQLPTVIK
jgi:threonyl-tRNA synthetase